jgi:hypothetical protein
MARSSSAKRQERVQGVRAPGALPQAMLQGTLQGAGPVSYYYKVLARCFVLGVLFPGPRSWILVFGCVVLGILFRILVPGFFFSGVLS